MNWFSALFDHWNRKAKLSHEPTISLSAPFYRAQSIDEVHQYFSVYDMTTDPYLHQDGPLPGRCYICSKSVMFEVEHPQNGVTNWRETLKCPHCRLINRWRGCLHLFETVCEPTNLDRIYITEALTPVYERLSRQYPNLTSSEYIPEAQAGEMVRMHSRTIRNEDVTRLTFDSNSFDAILSFDVLEHVPRYIRALEEFCRVLDFGGYLILTAPFSFQEATQVRATVDEKGVVTHLMEPCFHGDPLSDKGVLAYYDFGLELLGQLNEAGFEESYLACYTSNDWGYPSENIAFVARKPSQP